MSSAAVRTAPALDRGRLLTPEQVRERFFGGAVSIRHVLKYVRPRINLSRGVVRFYEQDVLEWIESRREAA